MLQHLASIPLASRLQRAFLNSRDRSHEWIFLTGQPKNTLIQRSAIDTMKFPRNGGIRQLREHSTENKYFRGGKRKPVVLMKHKQIDE